MLSSNKALELIKQFESCKLTAYPDPASELGKACTKLGLPLTDYVHVPRWQLMRSSPVTIGWGHTGKSIKLGDKWDQETADAILRLDVKVAEYRLNGLTGMSQDQFDALVSLAYNCPAAVAHGTTLRRYLESKDWCDAASELLKWHYANHVALAGLMRRREEERELFITTHAQAIALPVNVPTTPPAPSPAA